MPKLTVKLLAVAVATWMACAAYTAWWNPEIHFYTQLSRRQDEWSQKMDREYGHKVVVFGGSSCMFSINGEQMLEKYGIPTVNRGLGAGVGVTVMTLHALKDLREGDTLIVSVEPGLLTEPFAIPDEGVQLSFSTGHFDWAYRAQLGLPGHPVLPAILALRPGSFHAFTLVGKLIHGRPLYAYTIAGTSRSGLVSTPYRPHGTQWPGHGPYLSEDARQLLGALRDWCAQRKVRVAYSLPWAFAETEQVEECKRKNQDILLQIANFIPVLKDAQWGVQPQADLYADSTMHLTAEGSRLRTDELGQAVKQWDVWSAEELQLIVDRRSEDKPTMRQSASVPIHSAN